MPNILTNICTWPDCAHTAKGQCISADLAERVARLDSTAWANHPLTRTLMQHEKEQADEIERLMALREDSLDRRKLAKRLAARYIADPRPIAELCDGAIDPTGRLLGYVRDEALAAKEK